MSGAMSKIAAERNQKALLDLAMKPGNGEHRFYYTSHERSLLCPSTILRRVDLEMPGKHMQVNM